LGNPSGVTTKATTTLAGGAISTKVTREDSTSKESP